MWNFGALAGNSSFEVAKKQDAPDGFPGEGSLWPSPTPWKVVSNSRVFGRDVQHSSFFCFALTLSNLFFLTPSLLTMYFFIIVYPASLCFFPSPACACYARFGPRVEHALPATSIGRADGTGWGADHGQKSSRGRPPTPEATDEHGGLHATFRGRAP